MLVKSTPDLREKGFMSWRPPVCSFTSYKWNILQLIIRSFFCKNWTRCFRITSTGFPRKCILRLHLFYTYIKKITSTVFTCFKYSFYKLQGKEINWTYLRLLTMASIVSRWSLRYRWVPFSVTFFNWSWIRSIRYSILGIETIETFEIEKLLYCRRGSPVSEIYPSSLTLVVTSDITSWDCSIRNLKLKTNFCQIFSLQIKAINLI